MPTNEEMSQPSYSKRSHSSGEKKILINTVPNKFVVVAMQTEDANSKWYSKEVCELRQYEE